MSKPNGKEQLKTFEKKPSFLHNNEDFIQHGEIDKDASVKNQSKNYSEIKIKKNSSPVCFAESDQIREEYKLKP